MIAAVYIIVRVCVSEQVIENIPITPVSTGQKLDNSWLELPLANSVIVIIVPSGSKTREIHMLIQHYERVFLSRTAFQLS